MTTPTIPGWRELGEPDPFGSRYECERTELDMGEMTDDMVAFELGAVTRSDLRLPMIHAAAVARIRWLSRRLHAEEAKVAQLRTAVELGIESLYEIGPQAGDYYVEKYGTYEDAAKMQATLDATSPKPAGERKRA